MKPGLPSVSSKSYQCCRTDLLRKIKSNGVWSRNKSIVHRAKTVLIQFMSSDICCRNFNKYIIVLLINICSLFMDGFHMWALLSAGWMAFCGGSSAKKWISEVITCYIESGECLELHNGFFQGVGFHECAGIWVPNLGVQVAELWQVDLQQMKHFK